MEALRVKYVFAAELHTRPVAQCLGVAECTEVVECHSECIRLVLLQAVFVQARHALRLSLETIAGVPARVHFLAHGVAELHARVVSADVLEGRDCWVQGELRHHLLAETALVQLLLEVPLLAIVAQVVRGGLTFCAEVLMAVETSNPELTEMKLCRFREFFAILHFDVCINFTRAHLHVAPALRAPNE